MGWQKDYKKIISLLVCIFIGLLSLYLTLFYSTNTTMKLESKNLNDYNQGWETMDGMGSLTKPMVLKNIIPKNLGNQSYLFFRASHQRVMVYIEQEVIFQFGQNNTSSGKTPGCAWIMIPLDESMAGKTITVELQGVYPSYVNRVNGFYLGDSGAVFDEIIWNRLGSLILSVILVIIGVGMLVISIALKKGRITTALFRLGLLALVVGFWSALVLNILQFLIPDVLFLLHAEFFFFGLIMPASTWFLLSFKHFQEKKTIHGFFYTSIMVSTLVHVLQLLNILDYMESIWITHISMGLILIYLTIIGIFDLICKKIHREVKILAFSLIVLLFFWGLDLFRFYFAMGQDEGLYTRMGMLIFIILWALEIIRNISKLIEKMARTRLLEVLAFEDTMTGLKNRSAFEEKMEQLRTLQSKERGFVIEFDMNDLKYINDNYGHSKGDFAITTISHIIREEFEKIGTIYRIGGDEICVIVTGAEYISEEMIQVKIDQVVEKLQVIGKELEFKLSVAAGYAVLDPLKMKFIDEAYKEADRNMYRKKIRMKCMDQEFRN
jgi:diguanylate cyclase (GGDEF)-like protein